MFILVCHVAGALNSLHLISWTLLLIRRVTDQILRSGADLTRGLLEAQHCSNRGQH